MGFLGNRLSSKSRLSLIDENKNGSRISVQARDPVAQEPDFIDITSTLRQRLSNHERTIQQLQRTIENQGENVTRMQEDEKLLHNQVWAFSEQLNRSKEEADTLREQVGASDEEIRNLKWQLHTSDERANTLNGQVSALDGCYRENLQELASRSNTIHVLSGHNQKLQKRVSDMGHLVEVASRNSGTDLHSFYETYSKLVAAHDKLKVAQEELTSKLQSETEARSAMNDAMQATESENASLRTIIDDLQKEVSSIEDCQPQTLRSLLTLRLVEQASARPLADEVADDDQAQSLLLAGLATDSLDVVCGTAEIQNLAKLLPKQAHSQLYSHLRLQVCSMCSKVKFIFQSDKRNNFDSLKRLNEYHEKGRYFPCCYDKVCKECFKGHLLHTVETKWWYNLGTIQWFPCPRDGCNEAIGIRCEADLQICLERNCGTEAEEYVNKYIKAMAFRQALETLNPTPSEEVLRKTAQLHQNLIAANRMYSLFDPRFNPSMVDETGCIPEFQPGTILDCQIERGPSVPLFIKFLRRQRTPKACMVCSKSLFDIDYGDIDAWKAACGEFSGSWMWNLLVFPTSEIQQCDHDFEVCRNCTAEHLRGSLVSGGPSACDNLSCPQCRKKLCYQEVHQLADAETFAKYEKFLLQTYLSHDPNFRWCLAPLCKNGQLYERPPQHPKIACEDCNFEMCFKHEMPWHEGLTCDQFDSQRDHGDPSFAETQNWIRTNTKPCPGCEVGIQKGEACFHMTCSQCDHEFCWQCLANWGDIRTRGQEGHAEGCFFRTNDVRPTGIRGENLDEALAARNTG